ncbi:MAG: hypothetical protein ABI969_01085 [bacterium]
MMINRFIRASRVKAVPTQYGVTRRVSSALMLGLVTALTLTIAACGGGGGDSITGPTSPTGSYKLTTVQGKALPYRVYSEVNYTVDVADASVTLNAGGAFTAAMRTEERVDNHLSVYADTVTGNWVLTGSKVDLTVSDGTHTIGTWSGKTLSFTDSSGVTPLTYVYTMQ